ncbi:MAG: asparagine synthase (glutamine-hydrolyzing) [Alphaproteobacteria bacterium]|nr:asparagine synthase (glutamine-hydrolyzing) [Alphaproteobacteria bacterium]
MCGITGFLRLNHSRINPDHISVLKDMMKAMSHRGPDGEGIWHDDFVVLGHKRLSIVDLSLTGAQPMVSACERYVIIYNGEIYNHRELRSRVSATFKGSSDTETLLEHIAQYGLPETLPKLNGMFAFALWDRHQKILSLARDSVGIKPLYYAVCGTSFLFGSELKTLTAHPEFNRDIDEDALSAYFNLLHIPHPRTIYKSARKLPQSTYLEFGSSGTFNIIPYAPLTQNYSYIVDMPEARRVEEFQNILAHSVSRQLQADVPVAGFLSGGNDSSLISALMAKHGGYRTFSVGYEDPKFDESVRAGVIAKHLGLPHDTLMIAPEDVAPHLDHLAGMYDEPYADSSAIPTYLLSQHVGKFTKVALSGDGADELFAGYPRYIQAVQEWKRLRYLPMVLRPALSSLISDKPSSSTVSFFKNFLSNPGQSLPYLKNLLKEPSLVSYFHHHHYVGLDKVYCHDVQFLKRFDQDLSIYSRSARSDLRDILTYNQNMRLPDDMLTKVDRASMAASIEVRVPFLDQEIVAFSKALPVSHMTIEGSGVTKKIIKDALRSYLPDSIVDSPKTGFHIPMKIWLRTHFKTWAQNILSGSSDPFLNMNHVQHVWKMYESGTRDDLFYPIWGVLMYRQWQHHR